MSSETQRILGRALKLSAMAKARLVDEILASLDKPNEAVDALWRKEIEDRVRAYKSGKLQAVPLERVLARHRR